MVHEIALTITPTMACNMRCKHCFNGELLNVPEQVQLRSAIRFLDIAAAEFQDIKVTFHGGEPTLAGIDFYEKVFEHQKLLAKEYGVVFSNFFTTNGLLLDDRLIDLLMENHAMINISFDGPYNDVLRQHTEDVLSRIRRAKEKGARIRIFCTISAQSVPHLSEIYEWFKENDLDFKILPIEPRGYVETNHALLMDTERFLAELEQLYRVWGKDRDCRIKFYTFQEFAGLRRNMQFKPYWINREIALNPDGKIYPFGRPNDIHFCLGSPFDVERISDCFQNKEYKRLLSQMKRCAEERCGTCGSFHICRGVCICMSYVYGDDSDALKYECGMSDGIFSRILAVNDEIIDDFRAGNTGAYNDYVKEQFQPFALEGQMP